VDRGFARLRQRPDILLSFIHHAGHRIKELWRFSINSVRGWLLWLLANPVLLEIIPEISESAR
jgi:hypothetical protein